jgi:8-oxo-dGTP diphosphatase
MPIPDFLRALRETIGHDLVLLPAVAAVVERDDGLVLILQRSDTLEWSLPSGICEPGEDPSRTIAREILEETGLRARPTRILAVFGGPQVRYPNRDEAVYVTILFHCRVLGGTLEACDGEALDLRFVPLDEVPALRIDALLPASLAELLAGQAAAFPWDESWLDG